MRKFIMTHNSNLINVDKIVSISFADYTESEKQTMWCVYANLDTTDLPRRFMLKDNFKSKEDAINWLYENYNDLI